MQPSNRAETNALSDAERAQRVEEEPKGTSFYVYILRCADDSYYVGSTSDLDARIATHNRGEGASWTKVRRPVELAYHELVDTQIAAVRREQQLKGWSNAKKASLIAGDMERLHALSRRRSGTR